MILTGAQIKASIDNAEIVITPFDESQINPNSYNYRIGRKIKAFVSVENELPIFETVDIPEEGLVLKPHQMYLSHTMEVIGSDKYAMSLIGRSSIGRLGLFLQISANLGHTKSCHQWTLELVASYSIRIYPEMIIGQVSFWNNTGEAFLTKQTYAQYSEPQESFILT